MGRIMLNMVSSGCSEQSTQGHYDTINIDTLNQESREIWNEMGSIMLNKVRRDTLNTINIDALNQVSREIWNEMGRIMLN
jgi:hypothetical protein